MLDLREGRFSLAIPRSNDVNPKFLIQSSRASAPNHDVSMSLSLPPSSILSCHSQSNPEADIVPQRPRERPIAMESTIRRKRRSLSRSRRYVSGDSDERGDGIYDADDDGEEDDESYFPLADVISKLKLNVNSSLQSADQATEAALADSTIGFSASMLNLSGILGTAPQRKVSPRKVRSIFRRRLAPRAYYPPDRPTLASALRAASPSLSISSGSSAARHPRALRHARRSPSISRRRTVLAARGCPSVASRPAAIPLAGSWCPPLSSRAFPENAQAPPYIESSFCIAPARYDFAPGEKLAALHSGTSTPSFAPPAGNLSLSLAPSPPPIPFNSR